MITSEKVTSALFVLFSVFLVFESVKYPIGTIDNPGPGFLPLILGMAIGVLSLALLIRACRTGDGSSSRVSWPDRGGWIKIALIFFTVILFTLFLDVTGYLMNVFLLFLVLLKPVGKQKWTWSLIISLGGTLISYMIFDAWLRLPLPRGIWFR